MERVNLADAKAHFSELITRVSQGEEIEIMRRGKLMARLSPPTPPRKRIDTDALRRTHEGTTPQAQSAGEFIRAMRDSDRY
ncbi:type II toxin-antitoxin system Phd/YefM family antitoxin [soil metagenome]